MYLDCVLTASDLNPLYLDFIPIFIKSWKILLPKVDIKIILIATSIPKELEHFSNYLILFPPIEGIATAFIAQYIRILYPSLLNYKNGILITDIDMMPMNSIYYTNNIKHLENDKFICYRQIGGEINEIPIMYNIAKSSTWQEIFKIYNITDIIARLKNIYSKIKYENKHGGGGWFTDQKQLFTYVMNWHEKTNRFIKLNDIYTGLNRLDRISLSKITDDIKHRIKIGYYSDYHAHRPYKKYKKINDNVIELLEQTKEVILPPINLMIREKKEQELEKFINRAKLYCFCKEYNCCNKTSYSKKKYKLIESDFSFERLLNVHKTILNLKDHEKILFASYGIDGNWKCVKDIIQKFVTSGEKELIINNKNMNGDPIFSREKTLQIITSEFKRYIVPETHTLYKGENICIAIQNISSIIKNEKIYKNLNDIFFE